MRGNRKEAALFGRSGGKHFLGIGERFHGLLTLRGIARHFGEADEIPRSVEERGYHDNCPELGAVLADPPAFLLVPALFSRDLELVLRVA